MKSTKTGIESTTWKGKRDIDSVSHFSPNVCTRNFLHPKHSTIFCLTWWYRFARWKLYYIHEYWFYCVAASPGSPITHLDGEIQRYTVFMICNTRRCMEVCITRERKEQGLTKIRTVLKKNKETWQTKPVIQNNSNKVRSYLVCVALFCWHKVGEY